MTNIINILSTALIFLMALECTQGNNFDEIDFITGTEELSLSIANKEVFVYDDNKHQISYNEESASFRILNDMLNQFMVVDMDKYPDKQGDVVGVSINYTEKSKVKRLNGNFNVSKIENTKDGDLIWLWNSEHRAGAVILCLK